MEADLLADYWQEDRPVAVSGAGVWITDARGRRYLDAVGGVHVVTIGHGVAEIAEAMRAQAARLTFATGRAFVNEPQLALAELIAELAPEHLNRCFFASGGSEAVELALQIARHWHERRGRPEKTVFVGQRRSYHGGTLGTVSLGGHPGHRERLAPYLLPFRHVSATPSQGASPEAFAAELDESIRREGPENVCAFVAEPVSGTTSGAIVPPPGWFEAIRAVCDEHDVLLVVDEVVTGFGRTGRSFGIEHWDATPDIIVASKGVSSGYAPLAAVIVHDRLAEELARGPERLPVRLTYAGNPIACATGLAVQRYVRREGLVDRCRVAGASLRGLLDDLADRVPALGKPRGRGLLLGLPVWRDGAASQPYPRSERVQERLVRAGLDHGLVLVGGSGGDDSPDGDHLLISPPFTISDAECEELVARLEATVTDVLGAAG